MNVTLKADAIYGEKLHTSFSLVYDMKIDIFSIQWFGFGNIWLKTSVKSGLGKKDLWMTRVFKSLSFRKPLLIYFFTLVGV